MPGMALLDQLMANAWPPAVEETHDGWRYRWAGGVTRRANSVLAVDGAEPTATLIDRAEAFYRTRCAPTLQVSSASAPRGLDIDLIDRGYLPTARTLVLTAIPSEVIRLTRPTTFNTEASDTLTEEWLHGYWLVEAERGRRESDLAIARDVLLAPVLPMAFVTAQDQGEVVGVGQLVIERGWAGVQCMATHPQHRRRGVASAVLHGLAKEASRRGVDGMYLGVLADNGAAESMYRDAGFLRSHEYCYYASR